jgi:pimeloyl-ACP methyl ester carboxylesterase
MHIGSSVRINIGVLAERAAGERRVGLIPQARLLVYEGGSHGLLHIDKDRLNADLLAFLRA